MYKRTLNNSNFFDDTPIVACSLQIKVLTIQTPSFVVVTPLRNSNDQDDKSSRSHKVYYNQLLWWAHGRFQGMAKERRRLEGTGGLKRRGRHERVRDARHTQVRGSPER